MKKKFALSFLTIASVALLAACGEVSTSGSNTTGNEIGKELKIGFNFEKTGEVAAYGSAEQKGAQLAVDEINANGGADGKKIVVTDKDNKSETAEAATITTNLVTQSKVNALVGPATSGATAAAVANAGKAGVPLVTPSATQDNLTKGQDYLFRATFIDSFQGQIIAKYTTDNLKAKKVVLYYDNSSDYAKGIAEAFKKSYKGEIVATETFQSKDTDFQAALTKIKDKDFDAIVLPGYYTETGKIVNQARGMGIKQPIIGGDGEPSMFAALAYDSVYMVAEASKGAKNSVELKDNLAKLKDLEGVTGTMSIDKDHNPVKSALMIGLKDGKVESVESVKP